MREVTKQLIEDMLRDYNKINTFVEEQAQVWSSRNTPRLVTIDDDRRINALKRQRDVIGGCLEQAGNGTVSIIMALYLDKTLRCTIDRLIADGILNLTKRMAYQLRDRFLWQIADGLELAD